MRYKTNIIYILFLIVFCINYSFAQVLDMNNRMARDKTYIEPKDNDEENIRNIINSIVKEMQYHNANKLSMHFSVDEKLSNKGSDAKIRFFVEDFFIRSMDRKKNEKWIKSFSEENKFANFDFTISDIKITLGKDKRSATVSLSFCWTSGIPFTENKNVVNKNDTDAIKKNNLDYRIQNQDKKDEGLKEKPEQKQREMEAVIIERLLTNPAQKIMDTWEFEKIGGIWKVNMNNKFLKLFLR